MLQDLISELKKVSSPERAKTSQWFFKTGKGEYGEGDVFVGITTPLLRATIKNYKNLTFDEVQELLNSEIHEYRMAGLLILVEQFKKAKEDKRKEIYEFYLSNLNQINNWDLVDCSCRDIVGWYLFDKDRSKLYELAQTKHLWSQRVAIVSTWFFIAKKQYDDIIALSELPQMLYHKHDLMHKAVGWMLREAWKRTGQQEVELFLEKHAHEMPRTMLRYTIEKMSDEQRKYFMNKK
ncbi:MAG: DNA alkylation repair protein [Spirosomataceae bacterium]